MNGSTNTACKPTATRLAWLACFVGSCVLGSAGCVTIRSVDHTPAMQTQDWAVHPAMAEQTSGYLDGCCRPCSSIAILRSTGCIHRRCSQWFGSVRGWIHEKKEEASAPPWPRFHPVPTKPVFEPDMAETQVTPEVYGRFGKE